MTRVLILGSSHVGALKRADAAFRDQNPEIETDFFAVKAPMLRRGRAEDGIFRPYLHDDEDRALLMTLNGREEVDLRDYDQTLVVGFRAGPLDTVDLLRTHALLGDGEDKRPFRVSEEFVIAWLARMADDWGSDIESRFGQAPRCVFTVAPYPAESLTERAGEMNLAKRFKAFRDDPHAAMIANCWSAAFETAMTSRGFGYLAQPDDTLAGPYATRAEFAQQGTDADGTPLDQTDHRHMNADFGLRMLSQFARQHLNHNPHP